MMEPVGGGGESSHGHERSGKSPDSQSLIRGVGRCGCRDAQGPLVGKARDWTDQYTLLCEGCGYPLETIPQEGSCPECGRLIKSSLASARTGSAWQRRPGIGSWFATAWRVLARPK